MLNKKLLTVILIVALMMVAIPTLKTTSANKQCEKYNRHRIIPKITHFYSVEYKGWVRTADGVKFTYEVETGKKPLNSWTLISPVFKKAVIISSSEPTTLKGNCLTFNKALSPNSERTVWFVLKIDYVGLRIGWLPYTVNFGNIHLGGLVRGPNLPWC